MGYMLVDEGGGRVYSIPAGESTAGRAEDAQIHLAHPSISRHHARFIHDASGLWIEDLGSRNGTSLEGKALEGRTALQEGVTLTLGHLEFVLQHGPVGAVPEPPAPPIREKARATQPITERPGRSDLSAIRSHAAAPASPSAESSGSSSVAFIAFAIGALLGALVFLAWLRLG